MSMCAYAIYTTVQKTVKKNNHVHGAIQEQIEGESKGGWYGFSLSVFPLLSPVFELRELKRGNKAM